LITLDPYQDEAVEILKSKRRHILGDDYGVGKSYPAIEAAWQVAGAGPKLIVCPAYLIKNWIRYIREMYQDPNEPTIYVAQGAQYEKQAAVNAEDVDWLIVSYAILAYALAPSKGYTQLLRRRWHCVICDEAHRLRGRGTKATKAAYKLNTPYLFLLTADPIVKDAGDTFPLLRLCNPKEFTSYWRFVGHHCRIHRTPWANKVGDLFDPKGFNKMLSRHMLRRLPHEVGLEFPPEMPTTITVEMPPSIRKTYRDAKENWRVEHDDLPKAIYVKNGGALIHHLRGLTGTPPGNKNPKLDALKGILTDRTTRHVAVYCWYKETARVIQEAVTGRDSFLVTGSIDPMKRDDIVQDWKASRTGVLVATLGSLTEGANLQFCNQVVFYEEDWVPKTIEQALGRFIRRGSEFDQVLSWYLRVEKSVDEGVFKVQGKRLEHKLQALLEEVFTLEEDDAE